MVGYLAYTEYKDSGVDWIGEIPEHWFAMKGRHLFDIYAGYAPADVEFEDKGLNYYQVDDLNNDSEPIFLNSSLKFVKLSHRGVIPEPPLIIFPKRGAAISTNKVKIIEGYGIFDTNLMGIKVNSKSEIKFIAYTLLARGLWDMADVSTVPQINNKHINPMIFPLPSISEQRSIARFLDYKTAQIDALIAKKETLLEKLAEKRTALISQAVIALRVNVRTLLKCSIYAISKAIEFIPSLSHPVFKHTPPMFDIV